MSKRSKVALIILITVVLTILLSFLNEEPATDSKLESWENEIINPNNNLAPLEDDFGGNVFIIDVALKIEGLINKFFSFIVGFFASAIAAKICMTISQGTLCSTLLVLFILPGVLATFDKFIVKKN